MSLGRADAARRPVMMRLGGLAGVLALAVVTAAPAFAQAGGLAIELNQVADNGANCRMTYVINNGTGVEISTASYEMAVYGKDGTVAKLVVLDFGKLVPDHTQVVQFDLPDMGCKDISRISVNDPAVACEAATGGASTLCSDKRSLATKSGITFN